MRGIQPQNAPRLRRLLDALDVAAEVQEIDVPSWFLHPLKGDRKNYWSLRVSGNWRLTFIFENGDAKIVNLENYH